LNNAPARHRRKKLLYDTKSPKFSEHTFIFKPPPNPLPTRLFPLQTAPPPPKFRAARAPKTAQFLGHHLYFHKTPTPNTCPLTLTPAERSAAERSGAKSAGLCQKPPARPGGQTLTAIRGRRAKPRSLEMCGMYTLGVYAQRKPTFLGRRRESRRGACENGIITVWSIYLSRNMANPRAPTKTRWHHRPTPTTAPRPHRLPPVSRETRRP
jgi:hypothetical protein